MVAYSFKKQFAEPIATLQKRQTVRGARKRHSRVGEPMQLYCGMRTKHCRKLLDRDPICVDVRPIIIYLDSRHPQIITGITLNGVELGDARMEDFAIADGFGGGLADGFARRRMGQFWVKDYDWNGFVGLLIRWEPQI